jgi:large conductance mechanosensitive channel
MNKIRLSAEKEAAAAPEPAPAPASEEVLLLREIRDNLKK